MSDISKQAKRIMAETPMSELPQKLADTLKSVNPSSLDGVQETIEAWLHDGSRNLLTSADVIRINSEHKGE